LSEISKNARKDRKKTPFDATLKGIMDSLTSIYENTSSHESGESKILLQGELLSKFIKGPNNNLLQQVVIKGDGYGYYYSLSDKKTVLIPKNSEYYLISSKKDDLGRLRVYSHYKFMTGAVFLIPEEEIELVGWN
tara:strand:- start:4196 stop:4600 length:405 start_codon:yes stop_codon:yes gene_type:complete